MPKRKRENKPTYKTKKQALRHGYIQYGRKKTGRKGRKFRIYKVKGGYNVKKIK